MTDPNTNAGRAAIEQALGVLVGLPLRDSNRVVDLQVFGFGDIIARSTRRGNLRISEYALHVQCRWRIVRQGAIHVGSADILWPPAGSEVSYRDFDYDGVTSRRDELIREFVAHGPDSHVVKGVAGAATGDLRVELTDGCVIELWPDHRSGAEAGGPTEHWRFFRAGAPSHFVVTTETIAFDD